MSNFKKHFVWLVVLFSFTVSFLPSFEVFADNSYELNFTQEELNIINNGLTDSNLLKLEELGKSLPTPPEFIIQPRSIQTKIVKQAIKKAIANRNKIVKLVGRHIGRDAAVEVGAALNEAMPILRTLETWESLTYGTVQGQLKAAFTAAGMTESLATKTSFWIRLALEWIL